MDGDANIEGFMNSLLKATEPQETLPGSGSNMSTNPSTENSLEEEGENRNPRRKRQNKCLDPSGKTLKLVCGVNVAIEEVEDMVDVVLVGKIRGRNRNHNEMKAWVHMNWMG